MIEETIETPVIWDAIALIMTSLLCDEQVWVSYVYGTAF